MIGPTVQVTAKVDYAVRAMVELAAADGGPVKGEAIATAQGVPFRFLENILLELRHARLVRSQRGADGGYRLARPAETITIADVIRTVEGPIASIRSGGRMSFPIPALQRRCATYGWHCVRACAPCWRR
jgi:Rrf2 family protein